ncbi:molybdate ABC transporter substrate-binding protein [Thauera sp.]|jgi:molybdate transport system substrate-binding protein|uniref:molybdate ABC transporter substrate-binding protein n=1 Tax=Thauera sp. TaxID=1905334 RepID=UPI002A3605E0|nr:molybdate ABC transporter substrate-binding protein [Thauera sp.]MDX9884675.1 molybdate ABC transporter substrate-binding protein [Thauera sp.]
MSAMLRMIGLSVLLAASALLPAAQAGERITVAAAADLKFALDEIVADFRSTRPDDAVEVVYGSSGKFATQIRQGAPFDLYFSADIAYPRALEAEGLALGPTRPYAVGRIVLWSRTRDAGALRLQDLADPALGRIAIANPRHAPYGKRAEEALRAAGVWQAVQPRLVQGENIAQTAQFVQTGNATVGIIALSLALNPALAGQGGYHLIDAALHEPLEQGFILTRKAQGKALATAFADYIGTEAARAVLARYGFELPINPPDHALPD